MSVAAELVNVPPGLKTIRPYIKLAIEISRSDPVVAYHCYSYAVKAGMKTDYKTQPDCKAYLFKLMDQIEAIHKVLCDNPEYAEGVNDDMSGQMLVEASACKLFDWADSQDRASNHNKKVVKSFYTASILFDVLDIFNDEMSEKSKTQRKYARWKATYIHNCLKNNEVPIPGPAGGSEDPSYEGENLTGDQQQQPSTSFPPQEPPAPHYPPEAPAPNPHQFYSPEVSAQPTPVPRSQPRSAYQEVDVEPAATADVSLSYTDMAEAQKLCKHAGSALQYDDVPTAINCLEKCLRMLKAAKQ